MRWLGVSGLHAQPMSVNPVIIAVLKRAGFRMVCTRRLTAFEHIRQEQIDVQTWVRGI
jgi:hypothetical protein